ncbi:hypothetical protein ACFZDI_23665 [Streptomyces sp. NPDC007907]|uniref:hypothetical protein n=1 Tax=Streptomyces sp. NPDC007907 TaxID=3364789 RepID=UPI0036EA688B
MKKLAVALSVLTAVLVGCANGDGGQAPTSPTTTQPTTSPPTQTPSTPAQSGGRQPPIQSGDWRLDSVQVRDSGLGDFAGRARVTYTGDNPDGGTNTFTITVFKDDEDIASLKGSASDVPPGRTVTADLFSTDNFVAGPYKFDFQKDF